MDFEYLAIAFGALALICACKGAIHTFSSHSLLLIIIVVLFSSSSSFHYIIKYQPSRPNPSHALWNVLDNNYFLSFFFFVNVVVKTLSKEY